MKRTIGEALLDPTSNIARAAAQCDAARQVRVAKAREIMNRENITFEAALKIVWSQQQS